MIKELLVKQVVDRVIDRKKPLTGRTSLATGGAVGIAVLALPMLESPDETTRLIGLALMGLSVVAGIYKQKK